MVCRPMPLNWLLTRRRNDNDFVHDVEKITIICVSGIVNCQKLYLVCDGDGDDCWKFLYVTKIRIGWRSQIYSRYTKTSRNEWIWGDHSYEGQKLSVNLFICSRKNLCSGMILFVSRSFLPSIILMFLRYYFSHKYRTCKPLIFSFIFFSSWK